MLEYQWMEFRSVTQMTRVSGQLAEEGWGVDTWESVVDPSQGGRIYTVLYIRETDEKPKLVGGDTD